MRRRRRLIFALLGLCLAPSACGSTTPTPAPPIPPPDAAVDATARPAAADCARALDHLAELRASPPIVDPDRATLVEDCVAHSTATEITCILAAPDLNALADCDQNPPREAP